MIPDASYTRTNAQLADAGPYSVLVTNAFSGAVSSNALLAVITLPTVTAPPLPAAVLPGHSAAFTVTAVGTPPLGYQWRLKGEDLAGATTTTLTVPFVCASNVGAYSVLVYNDYGAVLIPEAFKFYHALNLPLKSLYGTTEGGILTGATNDDIRLESVGPVLKGAEAKITEKGPEMLAG